MNRLNSFTSSFDLKINLYIISLVSGCYLLLLGIDLLWTEQVVYARDWYESSIVRRSLRNNNPQEIPIYGSSMAQRCYIPEELGPNFYNYGMAGANFQKLYPLLENEFAKSRSTPVIIDVHSNFFNYHENSSIRAKSFIAEAGNPRIEELLKDFDRFSPAFRIPGFRYFGFYSDYWKDFRDNQVREKANYFNRGGAFHLPETPREEFEAYVRQRLATFNPFTVSPNLETRFLRLLESRPDREIILVISPSHRSAYGTEIQFDEMVKYLKQLEDKFPNVTYLAFDGRDYPDDHFKDTLHPNYLGAQRFTKSLRPELQSLGVISGDN